MTRLMRTDRFEAVVAEAPPVADTAVPSKKAVARLELSGDELILMSIRPSAWFIAFLSFKWIVGLVIMGIAIGIALRDTWSAPMWIAYQILVGVAAVRVGVALLQWASRLYVLTNRRVMRFKGVLRVSVAECPLRHICAADLYASWVQRPLDLGTLGMTPTSDHGAPVWWDHVAHAQDVHDRVVRAIRRAQSGDAD